MPDYTPSNISGSTLASERGVPCKGGYLSDPRGDNHGAGSLAPGIARRMNPDTGEVYYHEVRDEDGLVPSNISRQPSLQANPESFPSIAVHAGLVNFAYPPKPKYEVDDIFHPNTKKTPRTKRGKIQGFSNGSRRRLLRQTAKIRDFYKENKPLFATLTYPGNDVVQHSKEKWGRDLDTFRKRLNRWFVDLGYAEPRVIWRKEFKPRQSGQLLGRVLPHFHLIIFSEVSFEVLRALGFLQFFSLAWWEVVGSGDAAHLKAGTNVQQLTDRVLARFYVSKYMAKIEENLGFDTGRIWGVWGDLDTSSSMVISINFQQFYKLRRFFRKYLEKKGRHFYADVLRRRGCGFSILGVGDNDNPEQFSFISRVIFAMDRI